MNARVASLGDRLNAVLVKEVRQSLRGLYFRNIFWTTVLAATGIGSIVMVVSVADDQLADLGPNFFFAIWVVLSLAVHLFVPFSAFASMAAEWEENTFDLLTISELRPRQCVVGKVAAAGVLAILFYSAFAPFLISTFLMRSVPARTLVVVLAGSLLLSTSLSFVAVALSSLARSRGVRVVLTVLLFVILGWATMMSIVAGQAFIHQPELLNDPNAVWPIALVALAIAYIGVLAMAAGSMRLAHEEENRSSPLRVLVIFSALACVAIGPFVARVEPDAPIILVFLVWVLNLAPLIYFVAEPDQLGRRVATRVPKNRLVALVTMPFFPGGGRAMWLILLYGFVAMAGLAIAQLFGKSRSDSPIYGTGLLFAYTFCYLGIVSGVASYRRPNARGRMLARFAIPAFGLAAFLVPALLGLLIGVRRWMELEHAGNLFFVFFESLDDGPDRTFGYAVVVALMFIATWILNLPRMLDALRETGELSVRRST